GGGRAVAGGPARAYGRAVIRRDVVVSVICGEYPAMISSAFRCASASEPAQASATISTRAPASAAARAVERTQQSVATPASLRCGVGPVTVDRAGVHLPNVGSATTGPPRSARAGTTWYSS